MSFVSMDSLPRPDANRDVLNSSLYERLVAACRKGVLSGHVKVQNKGEQAHVTYVRDPSDLNRKIYKVQSYGETYQVCCPYCRDTRNRLYVPYFWGTQDRITGRHYSSVIKCFNEDCPKNIEDFSRDFRDKIDILSVGQFRGQKRVPVITDKNLIPGGDMSSRTGAPIGMTKSVDQLPESHPVRVFCAKRGVDPVLATRYFGLGVCTHSTVPSAIDRLVVPIVNEGNIVGWQARYMGDSTLYKCSNPLCNVATSKSEVPDGKVCPTCKCGNLRKTVKWLTAPGLKVSQVLYNYDNALQYPYVVVTEGPMDVIRMGHPDLGSCVPGPVVATFGHSLSSQQLMLLLRWQTEGSVYLMYDGDVEQSTVGTIARLKGLFPGGLVHVKLPKDIDPGDLGADAWQVVRAAGEIAGAKAIPDGKYTTSQ